MVAGRNLVHFRLLTVTIRCGMVIYQLDAPPPAEIAGEFVTTA